MKINEQIINIIFDAGKGAQSVPSREATVGSEMGTLPVPVRFGYTFEGWYLGDTLVGPDTVLSSEEDVRLVARWTKKKGERRSSLIKKQKTAIWILSAAIVVLVVALILVNNLISVSKITDVYFDKDTGDRLTQDYYIKKVDGVYGMYDADGVLMETNTDGYHIALSGNQYFIDQNTGDCKLYALVDSFNADIGELLGFGARVMMFPQIEQKDVYSIEVKNKEGGFTVLRYKNGVAYLKGTENKLNLLDDKAFAGLSVTCGYPLTTRKLDFSYHYTPRLPDGTVDYSAYGLSEADEPAIFTITRRTTDSDGNTCAATGEGNSYTVWVGDKILTGGGYYARVEGREAVYIIDTTVENTVLRSSEAMLTPTVIYPMSVNDYLYARDFILESADTSASNAYRFMMGSALLSGTSPIVDFSHSDLMERENSMYSLYPYTTSRDLMEGYFLDDDGVSGALESIYQMQISKCLKSGITEEAIKEYIFDGNDNANIHHISFRYNVIAREAIAMRYNNETPSAFNIRLKDICKKLLQQYGVANTDSLSLMDSLKQLEKLGICLENDILYDKSTLLNKIYSYCSSVLLDMGYTVDNNAMSTTPSIEQLQARVDEITKRLADLDMGVYYDKETNEIYVINEILISEKKDGMYRVASSLYDMIVEVEAYHFDFLDWNNKEWYKKEFTWMQLSYMTDIEIVDKNGNVYTFRLDNSASESGSKALKVYYRVNNGEEKLLDYTVTKPNTKPGSDPETIDAIANFREYYEVLMYLSLEGTVDQKELDLMAQIKDSNGDPMTPEKFKELPNSECTAIIYTRAVDTRGNTSAKVMRFYNYSETGHAFLTIDVVDAFDPVTGAPTTDWRTMSDPADGEGRFYVKTSYLDRIITSTDDVINQRFIESVDHLS